VDAGTRASNEFCLERLMGLADSEAANAPVHSPMDFPEPAPPTYVLFVALGSRV
jgi:hypothetical protein